MMNLNNRSVNVLVFMISLLYISCRWADNEVPLDNTHLENKTEVKSSSSKHSGKYAGVYLNTFNASGLILIYKSKIHHFNRNDSKFIYKDEEYDYEQIVDNAFEINRTYRLDRNDELVSKETILRDVKIDCKGDAECHLMRNGREFEWMPDLKTLLNKIGGESLINHCVAELVKTHSKEKIEQALNTRSFVELSGLHKRQLRDGDIYFKDILAAVIKNQSP